ncbi:MAG: hypothetical protein M1830_006548, partial [Pleopsidium flavum]
MAQKTVRAFNDNEMTQITHNDGYGELAQQEQHDHPEPDEDEAALILSLKRNRGRPRKK